MSIRDPQPHLVDHPAEDLFAPHPITGAGCVRGDEGRIEVEQAVFGPGLGDLPMTPIPAGTPLIYEPLTPLPDIAIAAPARPDLDFPGARQWPPPGAKLLAATDEELELQKAYPDKTWSEIIALLLDESAAELVGAGQYTKEIDAIAAEATKLSTAAEVMFEQESAMRREFGCRVEQAKAKRDKALRLIRRGR